ncbi:MAG: ROK family protein, partial [Bdellovibrionales bacterium]|nr:ROK family protein [Bdellovibrionales bacterium]
MAEYLWGIDLGGTKIEGIILPSDLTSEPIARIRIPTQAAGGYKVILSRISLLIDRLSTETGLSPHAIGVS